ncbi:MAG: type II toxin-antitoxin system RelE/ParE family toxin [Bauldia sp.]
MKIGYASGRLQRSLQEEASAKKAYGVLARRIRMRMQVLELAENLDDVPRVPPTRCHELTGDLAGHLAVDLNGNDRLVFKPVGEIPRKEDGGLDWRGVKEIEIVAIGDYH